MPNIRVLLVDDNVKFLRIAKEFLSKQQGIVIVGEALNNEEAIMKSRQLKPDVVLMDIRMSETNGLKTTAEIKQMMPHITIIIVSLYDFDEYLEEAMMAGASAFIPKLHMATELIPAIKKNYPHRD